MLPSEFFTPSGVRVRPRTQHPGSYNWLFFPGGPGIGSESLHELVDALQVPGTSWLVDLPGDGSNTVLPPGAGDPYQQWPQVLLEAVQALPNCVGVGHSTGGMYLLAVPELAPLLRGLVLVSTAPDARWHPRYVAMTTRQPLPAMEAATRAFEREPSNERLRDLAVASADWNFTPAGVAAGRELLLRLPYNLAAVDWSDRFFDHTYAAQWWPQLLPTLILSGGQDHIVDQSLWDAPQFQGENVLHETIADAGHFPWIEQPVACRAAFGRLIGLLTGKAEKPGNALPPATAV
jgi:pimeloyl-ACP methyl ester carboxylesterase